MAARTLGDVVQLVRSATGPCDRELLARFAAGDEDAFAVLVRRHAGMVLGVCRRVLPTVQDAEDACQATFLILARKAKATAWQRSVANWLYTTARRVASKANRAAGRRARREALAAQPDRAPTLDQMTGHEAFAALDEELARLPAIYREPLVLCYLEGLPRDEAARCLGIPFATLKSQLDRGRRRLADALGRRGIAVGAGLLTVAVTSPAGASPPVVQAILAAVGGSPTPAAAALAREVVVSRLITLVKGSLFALIGAVALTAGLAAMPTAEPGRPAPAAKPGDEDKVTVRVLDPDGKPVAGATVVQRSPSRRRDRVVEAVVGRTDDRGQIEATARLFSAFVAVKDGYAAAFSGSEPPGRALDLKLAKPLPIKGRLVDLEGKPVAGARVEVIDVRGAENDDLTGAYNAFRVNPDWHGMAFARWLDGKATGAPKATTTDKDGRFTVSNVATNHVVRLRFFAPGIESAGVFVFADPAFAKRVRPPSDGEKRAGMSREHAPAVYGPEFTHAARPEHRIVGTVVDDETGKPVPGVEVWGTTGLALSGVTSDPWRDHVETKTDAKGEFELTGLAKAVVYNRAFGSKEAKRYLHVRPLGSNCLDQIVTIPDALDYTPVRVEVRLRRAMVLRGTLLNQKTGKPVRGQVKWAALQSNTLVAPGKFAERALYLEGFGVTRATETWVEAGDDGRFRLRVPPGPCVLLASADEAEATVFTTAQVRDEDRKHLRKPEVGEGVRSTGGPRERRDELAFATLGMTWPLRWETGYAIVDADAEMKVIEVKVPFDPGATVTVGCVDPEGKPVAGVTMVGHGPYGRVPRAYPTAEIAVGGLSPKNPAEQLYFLHKGRKLCGQVLVKGDETGKVVVKLTPCGRVTGRVVDHEGKPAAGLLVPMQMTDGVANDLLRQKLFRDEGTATTDADGRFAFDRLFPAVEFDLMVFRPGFRSGEAASKRVTLKPGEARDVGEFRLRDRRQKDE